MILCWISGRRPEAANGSQSASPSPAVVAALHVLLRSHLLLLVRQNRNLKRKTTEVEASVLNLHKLDGLAASIAAEPAAVVVVVEHWRPKAPVAHRQNQVAARNLLRPDHALIQSKFCCPCCLLLILYYEFVQISDYLIFSHRRKARTPPRKLERSCSAPRPPGPFIIYFVRMWKVCKPKPNFLSVTPTDHT